MVATKIKGVSADWSRWLSEEGRHATPSRSNRIFLFFNYTH